MSDRSLERIGAACGILYVVLIYVGSSIGSLKSSSTRTVLVFLGLLIFMFFLGSLWSALRRAEGSSGWLSTTVFGAGLMSVTINMGSIAPVLAARYRTPGGLDPQLARSLLDMEEASYFIAFLPLSVLLAAFAIIAIRSNDLPGWLGWLAAALSAAFLAGGLAGSTNLASEWAQVPMLVYPLWVVATSVVLIRSAGETRPVETASPAGRAAPVG